MLKIGYEANTYGIVWFSGFNNFRYMLKIGTHDSATGEKPLWWSSLLTPFARTQGKTIREQFDAGCRLFDLRTKKVFGVWRGAHGWWYTKRSITDILSELNELSVGSNKLCVHLTFEGKTKNSKEFIEVVKQWKEKFSNIIWGPISSKYGESSKGVIVKYDVLISGDPGSYGGKQGFLPLDGKHWQTYIPIPWLWKKIYYNHPKFSEDYYTFVDFL